MLELQKHEEDSVLIERELRKPDTQAASFTLI